VLPPLREELSLHPGPTAVDGGPTWTLRDPVRNSFFRIGWAAFEILARWSAGSPAAIQQQVNAETALAIDEHDVEALVDFLSANQLLRARTREDSVRMARRARAQKQTWAGWLLHHYLFVRVPLIRPDRFLDRTIGCVRWIYTSGFVWATALALLLGLFLIHQQWDSFRTTLVNTLTITGALYYALALSCVKTIHEFGHAYTAKRLGCRVPTMGVALLVLWPVLYTDVNETWTLPHRRDRLAVGGAGMIAELTIAAWATVLWGLLPDGPARQTAFVLAAVTWLSSLAINLSPFMRFDGYFLLMDAVNMPNLHARSFAMARWWLREFLFGLAEEPPEGFSPVRQHLLVGFAFVVWAYRLAVFIGIAVLVYHFFIKILGVALFCVEIGWFVALPIVHELRQWHLRRVPILRSRRGRWTAAGASLVLLAVIVPWHTRIGAPAMLKADGNISVFIPTAARLAEQKIAQGQHVIAGQTLFIFESPDDQARLAMAEARIKTLTYQSQSIFYDVAFREQASVIREQLATAVAERVSLQAQTAQLTIVAAASGTVVDLLPGLHRGDWLSPREQLATIRGDAGSVIDAYVKEGDLSRIRLGDQATFYSDAADQTALRCTVRFIDMTTTLLLTDPELASTNGGGVAVRGKKSGLAPVGAVYRVRLEPQDRTVPVVQLRGEVQISGQRETLLAQTAKSVAAVVMRESGI